MSKKDTKKPGIYTKTKCGRLESVRVACQANMSGVCDIDDHLVFSSAGIARATAVVFNSGSSSVRIYIPRKRLLTLARLLRTMAKQLPKETE